MVVRIKGGYDTATGWPPDESTGVEFQNDVEIPGQFKGGGAGFGWGDTELPGQYGPGGFRGSPRITAPAIGPPPGTSLSAVPGGGGAPAQGGGDIFPPQNRPLRPGMSPAEFTGGTSTENPFSETPFGDRGPAFRGPRWGGNPPPGFSWGDAAVNVGKRFLPKVIGRRIPGVNLAIPDEGLASRAMDEAPPWSWPGAGNPGMPGATIRGPIPMNPDAMPDAAVPTPNFVRPEGEVPRTYPMWPTPPAPGPAAPSPQRGMPWPDTGVASTPLPPVRPGGGKRAAGPAATKQKPNLGHYNPFVQVARPNADVAGGARGRQSVPYTTALDLSHLFGGGR